MKHIIDKLNVGTKIKIGKQYSEVMEGFEEGEIITLKMLSFEYDSDHGGGFDDELGVDYEDGHEIDSIYHLFGNEFEWWYDNEILN